MSEEIKWYKYSAPVEIDGRWIVTITDSSNPEWEDKKEFESVEKADEFIKNAIVKTAQKDVENKKKAQKPPKRQGNYVNANYEIIELTDEQKKIVDENWDKLAIKELTQKAFNNPELNGHHMEAKSIKAYLASKGEKGESAPEIKTTVYQKKGLYKLTDPQKASIDSLLNTENPPPTKEIFQMIFPDLKLTSPLMQEYQSICKYIKEVNEEAMDIWDEPVDNRRYKPPRAYTSMIGLANRYVSNPIDPNKALYDVNNIKPIYEKNLKALLSYMQTTKFVLQASQYEKKADRELFESTFVRFCHDKASDLTAEEVDMYISAAAETVSVAQIERTIQRQEKFIDNSLDDQLDKDGNRYKLSMSLVESVNSLREKLDKSKGRLKGLIESVAGSRKDRIEGKSNQNDALTNLIQLWIDEKQRKDMLELAKKEHLEDATEADRISSLDDLTALVAGMTKEEATLGLQ